MLSCCHHLGHILLPLRCALPRTGPRSMCYIVLHATTSTVNNVILHCPATRFTQSVSAVWPRSRTSLSLSPSSLLRSRLFYGNSFLQNCFNDYVTSCCENVLLAH